MKTLYLTLKKKWFDMIVCGVKKEEYREIKPYWEKRLCQNYDVVHFRNGYSKNSPIILVEIKSVSTAVGKKEWGAPDHPVYIISLGNVIAQYKGIGI